jgi:predicted DNA-binding helix-hairpin-helix protein
MEHLRKMGVVTKRANYFITCNELPALTINEVRPENLRTLFTGNKQTKHKSQLQLF